MISEVQQCVRIIRRPVKHARLRVREDESVELIAPEDFTEGEIESILRRKTPWIHRQKEFFRVHPKRLPAREDGGVVLFDEVFQFVKAPELGQQVVINREEKLIKSGRMFDDAAERARWRRTFARRFLVERTAELARKHMLMFGRVFVRAQRTRWGNCSAKKNISLNWRLVMAPEFVIDYVVLHELVHTHVMNHSPRFWVHLSAICPDCAKAIDWLHRNRGAALTPEEIKIEEEATQ
jgi:predicted metal-dependent hydrolase